MLNIYKIRRTADTWSFDVFDSAVVVAASAEDAAKTYPDAESPLLGAPFWNGTAWVYHRSQQPMTNSAWVSPDEVTVTLIGTAAPGMEPQVVCSDYRGG